MTFYSEIFDFFVNKISDYDLLNNLDDKDIMKLFKMYLQSAISNFTKCKQDLTKRDDEQEMFLIELTGQEIEIISSLMVIEWIKPYITNKLNLSSFLGDSDFKFYSQANHLNSLVSLQSELQNEVERMIIDYSWDKFDFSSLSS